MNIRTRIAHSTFCSSFSQKNIKICAWLAMIHKVSIRGAAQTFRTFSTFKQITRSAKYSDSSKIIARPAIILKAANSVIVHNHKKLDKELWTENHEGELLTEIECETDRDEGYKIVQKIRDESIKDKLQLKDFVVLFRTNYQSRALEEAFNRGGIPYMIVGGIAFYKRKEIKDLIRLPETDR